jgi:hypothetical protein
MRFSVRNLMAAMAAIAVTIASLVYSNQWLGDICYTLYVAALFLACLAAIVKQGELRAFWLGFFAAAAVYGGLTILGRYGEISEFYRYLRDSEVGGYTAELCTSRMLTYSYDFIAAPGGSGHNFQDKKEFERFMPYLTIGHCAFALLAGWTAGWWTQTLYRTRTSQSSAR